MLNYVTVDGFKSLKNVRLLLGKITVLIGLNGSGKSSFIYSIGLLKESLGHQQFLTEGSFLNLGNFNELVSRGKSNISFRIGGSKIVNIEPFRDFPATAQYGYRVVFNKNGLSSFNVDIKINHFATF